jgi:hypothetical protein
MLSIPLSAPWEEKLRARAAAEGQEASGYAALLLQQALSAPSLADVRAKHIAAIHPCDLDEDQLADLLEAEKHAARRDRNASGSR